VQPLRTTAIITLFRVINRYVGNLPADAKRLSRLFGSGGAQCQRRPRPDDDALGMPPFPCWWISGEQHQEYVKPVRLGSGRKAALGLGEQPAKYPPEPNPDTKMKDVGWFALNEDRPLFAFGAIWTEYGGERGTKSKPIPGPHLVYGLPDRTERGCRANPSEGDAGSPPMKSGTFGRHPWGWRRGWHRGWRHWW
jgi:hypothetical protein